MSTGELKQVQELLGTKGKLDTVKTNVGSDHQSNTFRNISKTP